MINCIKQNTIILGQEIHTVLAKKLVVQPSRTSNNPEIHCGLITSGNQIIKHSITRDQLGWKLSILCFEIEAAGLMDHFFCLVNQGICNYSNSHKDKQWQAYAAATAAAHAKNLLSIISAHQIWRTVRVRDTLSIALVGFAASVIVFIDVSNKILDLLIEFNSTAKGAPEVFKHTAIQLPLIIDVMKWIEKDCRDGSVASEAQNALLPVINGSLQ